MPDDELVRPSYEVLAAPVISLRGDLERALARIADLEAQLRQNSKNSSRPPSSDSPFVKPAPKSLRGRSGRSSGGQPGHGGRTLMQVAKPDRVVRHRPSACGSCGASLVRAPVTSVETRQVFDIPKIVMTVVEHRLVTKVCGCGCSTSGRAPEGVAAPVQYGPNTVAICTYLYAGQFLSKQRTAEALSELFGTPLSPGTVSAFMKRSGGDVRASGALEQIRAGIVASPVANFDETGFRVAGRLHWVHSASAGRWSLLTVHPKRGTAG